MVVALALAFVMLAQTDARATVVPSGFQDSLVTSFPTSPAVLAFAPDGRLFVGEKASGRIRIVEAGALLPTEFLDVHDVLTASESFDSYFERGLLGITFDPDFASNPWVYVYYTVCKLPGASPCLPAANRVARFEASGNVAVPGSQSILLDDIPNDAGNHNAGWIAFGPDQKLYVSVGDGGADSSKAQDLATLNGKVLRLNADGTIPADNPFVSQAGARAEVWARGLRNPWRCRFQPVADRLFCADVGQNIWEELDIVTPGANYGWPATEGPFTQASFPGFVHPILWYDHSGPGGRASITGGDFGARTTFPGDYQQSLFFGDYAMGWIRRALLDGTGTVVSTDDFATELGTNSVTDIVAGPDGALYYTSYTNKEVRRISAGANRSSIAQATAMPSQGNPPLDVQFSSSGSFDPDGDPITFLWDFGDGESSTQANPAHLYPNPGSYLVTLTVSDGQPIPGPALATLTMTVGHPPTATIVSPIDGVIHHAGDVIALEGNATDFEDGAIDPTTLHWKIIFHHNTHTHPFIDDLAGSPQSFVWADVGESASDVGYEIILTATDSDGLTATDTVFVLPELANLHLDTAPPGLQLTLDGQPLSTPSTVTGVIGFQRTLGAPAQGSGEQAFAFTAWSDGGAATHTVITPAADTSWLASFTDRCAAPAVVPPDGGELAGAIDGGSGMSAACGGDASAEQVFVWTPGTSGQAIIETCGAGTSFDTVLYVRSGACVSGSSTGCNDDTTGCSTLSGPNQGSRLSPTVTAGQPYFIVVDGFGSVPGTFTLTVTAPSSATTTTTATTPTTTATTTTTAPTPTTSTTTTITTTSTTTTSPTTTTITTTSTTTIPTTTTITTTSTTTIPTVTTTTTSTTSTAVPTTSTTTSSSTTSSTTAPTSTSTTSSSTTSTTAPPAACPGGCEDGDACTADTCEASGCLHTDRTDARGGLVCVIANIRALLEAPRACARRCPATLERRLERLERLIGPTPPGRRCRRRVRDALVLAGRIERKVGDLAAQERLVNASRLMSETGRLRDRLRSFSSVVCQEP